MDVKHKRRLVATADDLDPVVVMLIERIGYKEILKDQPTDDAVQMVAYLYEMAYIMGAAKQQHRKELHQGEEKA